MRSSSCYTSCLNTYLIHGLDSNVPSFCLLPLSNNNSIGLSSIIALDSHRFLVLERDNRGLGIDTSATDGVGSKRLYLIDIQGATDITGISLVGSNNALPGGVVPVQKSLFLDIQAKLLSAGVTVIPEKMEGVTIGPKLNGDRFLLLIGTDNDFSVTQTGSGAQSDVCFSTADPFNR